MAEIDNVGVLNAGWGICGFTSSLYALYSHSGRGAATGLAGAARQDTRMLAEIKTFLVMLQAANRQDLLRDIENFTRVFGAKYAGGNIKNYIKGINKIATQGVLPKGANAYGLALPPQAVLAYLRMVCNFISAREVAVNANVNESLIGVSNGTRTTPYKGLVHWMYERGGVIYSWGKQFNSVTAANAKYKVVYRLSPTG